jgi:hypothetical protein
MHCVQYEGYWASIEFTIFSRHHCSSTARICDSTAQYVQYYILLRTQ